MLTLGPAHCATVPWQVTSHSPAWRRYEVNRGAHKCRVGLCDVCTSTRTPLGLVFAGSPLLRLETSAIAVCPSQSCGDAPGGPFLVALVGSSPVCREVFWGPLAQPDGLVMLFCSAAAPRALPFSCLNSQHLHRALSISVVRLAASQLPRHRELLPAFQEQI